MIKELRDKGITIRELEDRGDSRGYSFNVPGSAFEFIKKVKDVHIANIAPNTIRGNHYHVGRQEFIIVLFNDSWVLGWDYGPGTKPKVRKFSGRGAILIEVESEIAHAIQNTGQKDLTIIAFSNMVFDQTNSDTFKRSVLG
ncbi:MAG: hypothetical protein Q8M34_02415 [Thermodesulfovibrionales bacterium]|nr:hypothetical protein [Thermodesulfovibrionales bacterium]